MLSSKEQLAVQQLVGQAVTKEEQDALRSQAEATLAEANMAMSLKVLSGQESKAIDIAIEILVRLDAKACNGGWWFRAKRRPQLMKMYLG